MKQIHLLTKTAALAVCMSCAVAAAAAPGGNGKTVKKIAQAITTKVPRTTRGTVQRYSFSPKITRHIRTGIAQGRLQRTINDEVLQYSPIPAPIVLGKNPKEIAFSYHEIVASTPFEKEVLLVNSEEAEFYEPEIAAARQLRSFLLSIHNLDEEECETITALVLQNIKNHSLKTYLLRSLDNRNIYMLDLDLAEYFSLDKPVALAAFNYTLRHPHQQTLMMRRLLNNPLVDEEVKKPLLEFLSKSKIKPEEFPAFQTAISNVYQQYQDRIAAATESEIVQTQVNYYAQLLDRLGDFIASSPNNRRPKWNTANPKEMNLLDEIEWVQQNEPRNQFDPLLPYQKALRLVWDSAAPTYLTQEETLKLYEEFVKETGLFYPRSLRDKLKPGETLFKQEEELWDNLSYWRVKDPHVVSYAMLDRIYHKYQPQDK